MIRKVLIVLLMLMVAAAGSTACGTASSPSASTPIPTSGLPTSSSGGTVTGKLLAGDPLEPAAMPLYLAVILKNDDGEPSGLVRVDKATAPKAQFNEETGDFVFIDVPPGEYSIILDTISSNFLLKYPDTGDNILFEITGSESFDIGTLAYPDLYIPGS